VGSQGRRTEEVDELILAVPAPTLSRLVRTGRSGLTVVASAPQTAELSRLRTQPIPILHVFFTGTLSEIPQEPVGLSNSRLGLAFTDISQTWQDAEPFGGRTVLALSSSDPYGLPGTGDADDAMAMLRELAEYLDFEPGSVWGQSPEIDWTRTRYNPNADAQLFVNQAGSDVWRPNARCEELENLCFAGDFCQNRIGMTTIESAVTTGLQAANVIVQRRALGAPIEIRVPRSRPGVIYAWLRGAWGPYALAAKAWSDSVGALRRAGRHLLDS
jgi:hypothetical protein